MKKRSLTFAIVLMMVLGIIPTVSAQGGDNFLTCFNLSPADCEILMAAEANTEANLRSFNLNISLDFSVTGLGTLSGAMPGGTSGASGDMSLHVEGGGPVVVDESGVVPPVATQLNLVGTLTESGTTDTRPLNIVIVDGVLYAQNPLGEWRGVTFEDLLQGDAEAQAMLGGLLGGEGGELPSGAMTPGSLTGMDPEAMLESMGLGSDVIDLLRTPGFINAERLPDEERMGQTMYVFSLSADSGPLFASPAFQNLLNSALMEAAGSDSDMGNMAMLLPMLLSGTTITFNQTQWIGADDQFIHATTMDFQLTLDMNALMGAAGANSGGSSVQMPPIVIQFHLEIGLEQLNQPFEITAPAGAVIVTMDEFNTFMESVGSAASSK